MSFERFNLDPKIMSGVRALGYTSPTPIQLDSIPPIMEGNDVMGLAQTGTGKTAAFVLPILQRLLPGPRGRVRALIIAPTRELTEQTNKAIGQLGRKTGLACVSVYGGVSMQTQVNALRRGADIVCACPGRLLDHVRRGTINLSKVEVLVLDEADHMFDMGFLPDIRAILKHLPAGRQTLLFSATMPAEINTLARDILRAPDPGADRPHGPGRDGVPHVLPGGDDVQKRAAAEYLGHHRNRAGARVHAHQTAFKAGGTAPRGIGV